MADSTNKAPSKETQDKVYGGFSYDPELGKNLFSEGPTPVWSQTFEGYNFTVYKQGDDYGAALYNGKASIHFDVNNNIILSAGPPSQSGCGGKLVMNTQQQIQKSKSVAIEVTGRDDGGTLEKTTNANGDVEEKNLPSYSLKVYGPTYIESIGGDVSVKGDNVTVSAGSTLNLKSNKDITLQAGENGGKIQMYGSVVDMNVNTFNRNITGGDYTNGAGEVRTDQNKGGSEVAYNTPGSVRYIVNGDYTVGVTGKYTTDVTGKYILNVDQDYGLKVLGDYANVVSGKGLTKISGVGSKSSQTANYLIEVLANEKKSQPGFEVNSNSLVQLTNTEGGFKFEIAKQAGLLELKSGEFKVETGKKLGSFSIDEKQSTWEFNPTTKINMNSKEIKIEQNKSSYIKVSATQVDVVGPKIYLN